MATVAVMLEAMRKQKLDPKHVRWFFYRKSLFVQPFTLIADGIWWCIATGFVNCFGWLRFNLLGWLPVWFWVDERARQMHTFLFGRTGVGKSVLLHNLIRHYLVSNRKPSLVLFDPHGDLARTVARDRAFVGNDRLVYVNFNGIAGSHVHLNPFELKVGSETHLNHAQVQLLVPLSKSLAIHSRLFSGC